MRVSGREFAGHAVNTLCICVVPVIAQLELDIDHDKNKKCQTYSKPGHVDDGETLLPLHVSESRDQVMPGHDGGPMYQKFEIGREGFKNLDAIPVPGF